MTIYLTNEEAQELSGIWGLPWFFFFFFLRNLQPALSRKCWCTLHVEKMRNTCVFVLALFQHNCTFARNKRNFQVLNGMLHFQLSSYHHLLLKTLSMIGGATKAKRLWWVRPMVKIGSALRLLADRSKRYWLQWTQQNVLAKIARSPNLRSNFLDFEFKPV